MAIRERGKTDMKTFETPKMEIIRIENTDIITTSKDTDGLIVGDSDILGG